MVAVVVPSPASLLAFWATSLIIWAPRFSYWSSSSISLATVTPSLVTVGAPKDFSRTTTRPEGPSVTLTACASFWTPRRIRSRASVLYAIDFAGIDVPFDSEIQISPQRTQGAQRGERQRGWASVDAWDDRSVFAADRGESLPLV